MRKRGPGGLIRPWPLAESAPTPDNPSGGVAERAMDTSPGTVASLVDGARRGDQEALAALMPLVYDELRRLAARHMRRERPGQTLQATALVHDVYLRLLRDSRLSWQNRAHFFGIAARSMRQILIERARTRGAAKRGGSRVRVTFEPGLIAAESPSLDLEALDEALTRLDALDAELARVVEVRFFGGLSIEETAEALKISPATVKRRWTVAKAWLARELGAAPARDT
jgi:RNA polymerase sigma factor (TIGR02999 family)